jgi:hypothetical protein
LPFSSPALSGFGLNLSVSLATYLLTSSSIYIVSHLRDLESEFYPLTMSAKKGTSSFYRVKLTTLPTMLEAKA